MPMRPIIIILLLIFANSCLDGNPKHVQYEKGDFWVANFRNNSYPSKAYRDDKIYCSSLEIGGDKPNFLYCLNLRTGKIDWATQVKNWASQAPIICDSFIYYCSFVGDIYKFDKNGNQIWSSNFSSTYGGHCINPLNGNLLVSTVAYGLREIDFKTGKVIDSIGYGKMDVPFPVFQNDTIYQVINDTLSCRKNSGKALLWQKTTGTDIDKLFLIDQRLYYFDNTQRLYCLNALTGNVVWQSNSIFPAQPFNPHLVLENGKILSYFSSLYNIYVIDPSNGTVLEKKSDEDLRKEGLFLPKEVNYSVAFDGKHYDVTVMPSDFRDDFEIMIVERHNR